MDNGNVESDRDHRGHQRRPVALFKRAGCEWYQLHDHWLQGQRWFRAQRVRVHIDGQRHCRQRCAGGQCRHCRGNRRRIGFGDGGQWHDPWNYGRQRCRYRCRSCLQYAGDFRRGCRNRRGHTGRRRWNGCGRHIRDTDDRHRWQLYLFGKQRQFHRRFRDGKRCVYLHSQGSERGGFQHRNADYYDHRNQRCTDSGHQHWGDGVGRIGGHSVDFGDVECDGRR